MECAAEGVVLLRRRNLYAQAASNRPMLPVVQIPALDRLEETMQARKRTLVCVVSSFERKKAKAATDVLWNLLRNGMVMMMMMVRVVAGLLACFACFLVVLLALSTKEIDDDKTYRYSDQILARESFFRIERSIPTDSGTDTRNRFWNKYSAGYS